MNLPLKFCVSCGRTLSSKESSKLGGLKQVIRAGITKKLEDNPTANNYGRARRSYGFEKGLRQFFLTLTYIVGTILLYLVAVSYCMKDPKVAAMVHGILSQPAHHSLEPVRRLPPGRSIAKPEEPAAHNDTPSRNDDSISARHKHHHRAGKPERRNWP
jgi:hypothetical protein